MNKTKVMCRSSLACSRFTTHLMALYDRGRCKWSCCKWSFECINHWEVGCVRFIENRLTKKAFIIITSVRIYKLLKVGKKKNCCNNGRQALSEACGNSNASRQLLNWEKVEQVLCAVTFWCQCLMADGAYLKIKLTGSPARLPTECFAWTIANMYYH